MKMMDVKTLKELLEKCDDTSNVKILSYNEYLDVESVLIEYVKDDDYKIPCIILKTD